MAAMAEINQHNKPPTSAKVPRSSISPNRTHIDKFCANLDSEEGAQKVISAISTRGRRVASVLLSFNNLNNSGCTTLFKFLCSDAGRKYHLSYINLARNYIGDAGLDAISEYLRGNEYLRQLYLMNNVFRGNSDTIDSFTRALNTSNLHVLSLSANVKLSDDFISLFLPHLSAPCLHVLNVDGVDLTSASVPHIVEYLTSSRCRLRRLTLNCNDLGTKGVSYIIEAIRHGNWGLTDLEVYANDLSKEQNDGEEEGDEETRRVRKEKNERALKFILARNKTLTIQTEREALYLLRHSRLVLFRSATLDGAHQDGIADSSPPPAPKNHQVLIRQSVEEVQTAFPFTSLPMELQLYILSFLAPSLSSTQVIRIYEYASSPLTLPPLVPSLNPASGVHLPSSGQRRISQSEWDVGGRQDTTSRDSCMGAGTYSCEGNRARWLLEVGCDKYERHGGACCCRSCLLIGDTIEVGYTGPIMS